MLAQKYRARLADETLMVNELFVSAVYRPVSGAGATAAARLLARTSPGRGASDLADTIEACEKLGQTVQASLARYEPERLSTYELGGRTCSHLLEFLGELINGEWQPVPLPRAPVNEVLATTRPLFGSEVIEYRLPTQTRLGAMVGLRNTPHPRVWACTTRCCRHPLRSY